MGKVDIAYNCHRNRHDWHPNSGIVRRPVTLRMQAAKERGRLSETQPQPLTYYTVNFCRHCGFEEKVAHGFRWEDVEQSQDGEVKL